MTFKKVPGMYAILVTYGVLLKPIESRLQEKEDPLVTDSSIFISSDVLGQVGQLHLLTRREKSKTALGCTRCVPENS